MVCIYLLHLSSFIFSVHICLFKRDLHCLPTVDTRGPDTVCLRVQKLSEMSLFHSKAPFLPQTSSTSPEFKTSSTRSKILKFFKTLTRLHKKGKRSYRLSALTLLKELRKKVGMPSSKDKQQETTPDPFDPNWEDVEMDMDIDPVDVRQESPTNDTAPAPDNNKSAIKFERYQPSLATIPEEDETTCESSYKHPLLPFHNFNPNAPGYNNSNIGRSSFHLTPVRIPMPIFSSSSSTTSSSSSDSGVLLAPRALKATTGPIPQEQRLLGPGQNYKDPYFYNMYLTSKYAIMEHCKPGGSEEVKIKALIAKYKAKSDAQKLEWVNAKADKAKAEAEAETETKAMEMEMEVEVAASASGTSADPATPGTTGSSYADIVVVVDDDEKEGGNSDAGASSPSALGKRGNDDLSDDDDDDDDEWKDNEAEKDFAKARKQK